MAKDDKVEDLDLGVEKPSKKKLLVMIALVVLLVLIGGGVAAYFAVYNTDESEEVAEAETDKQQPEAETDQAPAQYVKMDPVFVVNLPDRRSLLQVGVSLRVSSDQMVEFVKHNDPMLRHHLINLLQQKEAKSLQARAAKKALQVEMLNEINRVAKELSGPGEVDALYFTSFVMQ